MLFLEAIKLDPDLSRVPKEKIVIVGSVALAMYSKLAGLKAATHPIMHDLDLCVDETTYALLLKKSLPADSNPQDNNSWRQDTRCGNTTLRKNYMLQGLDKPVQLDVGPTVHNWSYGEVCEDALNFEGFKVLSPLRQLAWYEALNRKDDSSKMILLRTVLIPKLIDCADLPPQGV